MIGKKQEAKKNQEKTSKSMLQLFKQIETTQL